MSDLIPQDFHDRLTELNKWQIDQQEKIKALQKSQKRLMDLERHNAFPDFNSELFENETCFKRNHMPNNDADTTDSENNKCAELQLNDFGTVQLKLQPYKLQIPKLTCFDVDCCSVQKDRRSNSCSEKIYKLQENNPNSPKKFLKRGDGLARFRMSLADFKGPPKIYKEKKIKTYVHNKPNFVIKKLNSQNVKSSSHTIKGDTRILKTSSKSLSIPVNIYVSDNKTKEEIKKKKAKQVVTPQDCSEQSDNVNLHQSAKEYLKCGITQHNIGDENRIHHTKDEIKNDHNKSEGEVCYDLDIEKKKDEKELKIFEILEQKVNDSSFCSSSSFVDKLMEKSPSSALTKASQKDVGLCMDSYAQGLKSLYPEFVDEEHIRFQDDNESELNQSIREENFKPSESQDRIELIHLENTAGCEGAGKYHEIKDVGLSQNEKVDVSEHVTKKSGHSQPFHVNKTLLQKYIKDFKKFKINFSKMDENAGEAKDEMSQNVLDEEESGELIKQREIDLKLKRKGLQDNVKHLMNWENSSRKRLVKRNLKKVKLKPKKVEKTKTVEKDETEKITFNSALLKTRLDELEKEIEIFRNENKIMEKLQKECNVERLRLAKEKKDFEKQIYEEKQKFEANISEERKKLQKEKVVFEKYCKQIKNQPNRQGREEIANLKKEIENLRETLTTKESRWGSSQARLRNQIKVLEKENIRLKSENDEYKRLQIRKVTFENEGSINTKIINAINSEMNKLKPTVMKDANGSLRMKNKSLSSRVDRNLEKKPIRRIKSAPNMEKVGVTNLVSDPSVHDKAASSVSRDSGIETNEPAGISQCPSNKIIESNILSCNTHQFSKVDEGKKSKGHIEDSYTNVFRESSDRETDISEGSTHHRVESFRQEAIFDYEEAESENLNLRNLGKLDWCNVSEEKSDYIGSVTDVSTDALNFHKFIEIKERETGLVKEGKNNGGQPNAAGCFERKGIQHKNDFLENLLCREENFTENRTEEHRIRERTLEDGAKEICYPNGNVKKIYPGNKIVKIVYYNGDVKETNILEGSEKYYYAETKTWHTTYKDGLEVLEFPNGQTERRHANGTTEISFPNGCVRYCDLFGRDEWRFLDGTVIKTNESGHRILLMPNGQKEIHTKEFKRREYPDGTVRMLYADGTQETRYACGRVRLKDKAGNLVMDSEGIS